MNLLASVRGTLLDAKCFRNILEFKDAHNVPHLSTEIIFQMAILGALRLRWISNNTAHISTVDKDHKIQRNMSEEDAIKFFLEKSTNRDRFQRQFSINLIGKLAAYGMSFKVLFSCIFLYSPRNFPQRHGESGDCSQSGREIQRRRPSCSTSSS